MQLKEQRDYCSVIKMRNNGYKAVALVYNNKKQKLYQLITVLSI